MNYFSIFKVVTISIVILLSSFIYLNIPKAQCQRFSEQAQSFIQGNLDISGGIDTVSQNGKYYWPQGPFPALILIPFQVIFSSSFNQTFLQPVLILLLIFFLYKLARLKKYSTENSLFLIYAFLFGSTAIGIITEPCYSFFAHLVTMVLQTAFLFELEAKGRWFILGILLSCIIATRPTAGVIILPALYLIFNKKTIPLQKLYSLAKFMLPIIFTMSLLTWFNWVRFSNIFETGYNSNNVGDYLNGLRNMGLFSITHLPSNFYYYFLISVQPVINFSTHITFPFFTYNRVGLSFFIVSPFFIFAFKSLRNSNSLIRLYWVTILIILLVLLTYYAPGWVQFGPRYTSDFMPILYLLTLYGLNSTKFKTIQIIIILLSSIINIYLLTTGFFLFKRF